MKRIVVVGGFGNGIETVEGLAEAFSAHYDDADAFTFAEAVADTDRIKTAARKADVGLYSASVIMAKEVLAAEYVHLIAGAMPRSRIQLAKSGLRNLRAMTEERKSASPEIQSRIDSFNSSRRYEIRKNFRSNLMPVLNGAVSRANAISNALDAVDAGTPANLVHFYDDAYFKLTMDEVSEGRNNGVKVFGMDGQHYEPMLRPEEFVQTYLNGAIY